LGGGILAPTIATAASQLALGGSFDLLAAIFKFGQRHGSDEMFASCWRYRCHTVQGKLETTFFHTWLEAMP
jgi:hypothetical protein